MSREEESGPGRRREELTEGDKGRGVRSKKEETEAEMWTKGKREAERRRKEERRGERNYVEQLRGEIS